MNSFTRSKTEFPMVLVIVLNMLGVLGMIGSASAQTTAAGPIQQIQDIVVRLNSRSDKPRVEDFLHELPPAWRQNFTFVYQSNSIQDASREFPRAIAFAIDGSIVLTFNGHTSQFGYERVEMAIANAAANQVEFRDVTLCDNAKDSDCKAILSEANPKQCAVCHGSKSPHYIWQRYNVWSGVYGSADDVLPSGEKQEDQDYRAFHTRIPSLSRYKELLFSTSQPEGESSPYRSTSQAGLYLDRRPNTYLTMVLMRQQARFLAKQIVLRTASKPHARTALIRTLAACGKYTDAALASAEASGIANEIGLPFDDHWTFSFNPPAEKFPVFEYNDGLMRLPGLLLSYLLPQIPEYSDLLEGKQFRLADLEKANNLEVFSERTRIMLKTLDALGPVYPNIGGFNALKYYAPTIDNDRLCALGD